MSSKTKEQNVPSTVATEKISRPEQQLAKSSNQWTAPPHICDLIGPVVICDARSNSLNTAQLAKLTPGWGPAFSKPARSHLISPQNTGERRKGGERGSLHPIVLVSPFVSFPVSFAHIAILQTPLTQTYPHITTPLTIRFSTPTSICMQ